MKKLFLLALALLSLGLAKVENDTFIDDKNRFSLRIPEGWSYDVSGRRKIVVLRKDDGVTEVAVDDMPMKARYTSGKAVADDVFINYDGWEYLAGRYLNGQDARGANSGFSVMYTKRMMKGSSYDRKIIIQEYYFIKSGQVIVLTLQTDTDNWENAKQNLLFALDSFQIF